MHALVERFRYEKLENRDIAVDHEGREARHNKLLHTVMQRGFSATIKIAKFV